MNKTDSFAVTLDAPGYYSLAAVLQRAFKQASEGKGKERHANALPFDQQPMQTIAAAHGVGFLTGQASKKAEESHGLPHNMQIAELLGAINYLAGAVIFLESDRNKARPANDNSAPCEGCTDIVCLKPGKCRNDADSVAVDLETFIVKRAIGKPFRTAGNDYCTRSGDKSRPICGECAPGPCAGI